MSIYADQLFVNAEVERRLELAGVTAHRHQPVRSAQRSGLRRLVRRAAASVRELGMPGPASARQVAPCGPSVQRPRHP